MLGVMETQAQTPTKETLKIRGTRLAYPLMRKWISEFNKQYPNVNLVIAPQSPADSIDLTIASYNVTENELKGERDAVVVARYVQLPIVNSNRPDLPELQKSGVTDESLRSVFFGQQPKSFITSTSTQLSLYVRDRPVCAVKAFAGHFGEDASKIRGTGIKGDDEDLADSVRNNIDGFTFNNLGFIYDPATRKISEGLAIVPLDLNRNGTIDIDEKIYDNLDHVIEFIERTDHPAFVNEEVNLVYKKNSSKESAGIFLNWILKDGQRFNHELGFLQMDKDFLDAQFVIAEKTFKHISVSSNR